MDVTITDIDNPLRAAHDSYEAYHTPQRGGRTLDSTINRGKSFGSVDIEAMDHTSWYRRVRKIVWKTVSERATKYGRLSNYLPVRKLIVICFVHWDSHNLNIVDLCVFNGAKCASVAHTILLSTQILK